MIWEKVRLEQYLIVGAITHINSTMICYVSKPPILIHSLVVEYLSMVCECGERVRNEVLV